MAIFQLVYQRVCGFITQPGSLPFVKIMGCDAGIIQHHLFCKIMYSVHHELCDDCIQSVFILFDISVISH